MSRCLRLADINECLSGRDLEGACAAETKSAAIRRMVTSAHADEDMCDRKNCVFVS